MTEAIVESAQDFLAQFAFIFPCLQQEIALFWHGRHFGEGQVRTSAMTEPPKSKPYHLSLTDCAA
jgi:hypothetical protein